MIKRYFMGWNFKKKLQPLSAGRPVGRKIVLKLSRSDFLVAGIILLVLGLVGAVYSHGKDSHVQVGAVNLDSEAGSLLEIEAEKGTLEAPMAVYPDSKASGGKYVSVRSGKGGHAEYAFNIQEKGDYVVWGWTIAPNGGSDSFFVSMDNGEEAIWSLGQTSEWRSSKVSKSGSRDPVVYHLTAGTHRIKFRYREPNAQLDKLLITKDLAYIPMMDDLAKWKDLPPPHFDEAIMWFFPNASHHGMSLDSEAKIIQAVENCKRMGFTTILALGKTSWFSFPSKLYPVENPGSFSGLDFAGIVAREARKRGMKVGLWIDAFKSSKKEFPDYPPCLTKEKEITQGWNCPDHPGVKERALKLTEEMIEKYHPDLMVLDYERYRSGYDGGCFCDYSLKRHAEFARTHPELSSQEAVRKFSQGNIESFVKEWVNLCKKLDPKIKTGAYTQYNCPKWVYGLPFDYPMKYVSRYLTAGPEGSTLEDVAGLTKKYSEWTKGGNSRSQLVPILSAYDYKTPERMEYEYKILSHTLGQLKAEKRVFIYYAYDYLLVDRTRETNKPYDLDEGVAKATSKALGGSWK